LQTIRRYANRKLYHLEGHRYVNLEGIADLIRAGEEVAVSDQASGQEITTEVLAQVIAQERPAGLNAFLAALIRGGRYPLEEAGRLFLSTLGLPTRAQWLDLEAEVARLEALLARLTADAGGRPAILDGREPRVL
jgi:hypothetical protein